MSQEDTANLARMIGKDHLLDFTIARLFQMNEVPKDGIEKLLTAWLGSCDQKNDDVLGKIFDSKEGSYGFMMGIFVMLRSKHIPAFITDRDMLGTLGGMFKAYGDRHPEAMNSLRESFFRSCTEKK